MYMYLIHVQYMYLTTFCKVHTAVDINPPNKNVTQVKINL